MDTDTVTLAPDRGRVAGWTVVGLVATGLAAFAFSRTEYVLFAATLTAACAVPTGLVGLQLLAPEAWTLHVSRTGVHGMVATFEVVESFATLRAVELRRVAGEAVLVLLGTGRRRRLLLPLGCDLAALQELLRAVELDRARGR